VEPERTRLLMLHAQMLRLVELLKVTGDRVAASPSSPSRRRATGARAARRLSSSQPFPSPSKAWKLGL
jgi:hypothetical protein